MSISFEQALDTLKCMFPEWDEETLSSLLVSNHYHVERTIETVLSMSDSSASSNQPAVPSSPSQSQVANPNGLSSVSRVGITRDPRYRGTRCNLPEDFLRPPGYQNQRYMMADEELALMLQNEMFQREARMLLGPQFLGTGRNGQSQQQQQFNRQQSLSRQASTSNASSSAANSSNEGIMKSIQSMGAAAKRNLSMLAHRFSQPSTTGSNSREFKHLVENDADDNDEGKGTEVVTFEGNMKGSRSNHVLSATSRRDDDAERLSDSENPLIMYKSGANTANVTINSKKDK